MPAKITKKIRFKRLIPDARTKFSKDLKKSIVKVIRTKIESGVSPVKGQNRYPKYSEGYAKKKGRRRPVDMTLTGKMLDSLKAVLKSGRKTVVVAFTGRRNKKLAEYHTLGDGQPMRKLLPVGRETFKRDILNKIVRFADEAIKFATRRQR